VVEVQQEAPQEYLLMIGKENKPFFFLNNQSFSWEVTIIKETLEIFCH
jgi:hypothetical protein